MTTPVTEDLWADLRRWSRATDHAPSTTAKGVRYLRDLERERGLPIAELTLHDVQDLLARGRQEGVKPSTLNSWIREINLWARFRELGWKALYFRNRSRPVVRVPSEREIRKLRDLRWPNRSADARNRSMLAVLLDVGPRRSELALMDLQDLTRSQDGRPVLMVRHGKGGKERPLWIDDATDELLRAYIERYRSHSHPTALFTTPRGRISDAYLARVIQKAGALSGAPWLSPHKLRHACCDSLLDAGVSIPSVAALLGHSRWETTALYRTKRLEQQAAEKEVRAAAKARFGRRK
ncbi:MAG: site-specific integrase [Thermoplasmata archaeon]|nr:site-specific integrase [Thermoplasmata archaeon]